MRYSKCVVCYESIGWIGLVVNVVLSAMKLFVGVLSGSHALVADALYSAKDVVTSVLIIVGLRISRSPVDQKHPFGHGKAEFLLALVISFVLLSVTGWLLYNVGSILLEGNHQPPHMIALWAAVLSLIINLFFHGYSRCVGHEINSPMVKTLSRHHRSDAYSSLAVALAIIGSHYLGMPWLDSLVAVGESLHLLYLGGEVFLEAFHGLMDSSAPRQLENEVRQRAAAVKGVEGVEALRTRRVGQEVWVELTVGVDPEIEISVARGIAERVAETLAATVPHLGDVTVRFRAQAGSVPEFEHIRADLDRLAAFDADALVRQAAEGGLESRGATSAG
ncbi:MAG: magnetosome biogenesis CDF transporter MamM [Magnetococcus sp. WYHC-3]